MISYKEKIHNILAEYWKYPSFRPLQENIILSILEKKDTLALLPTGGGKSICFQVPALALDGICIVVSPLIALMKDQVAQLTQRGIKAIALHSGMKRREIDIALDNCEYNDCKFIYISPERLKSTQFVERVKHLPISLLAIDEAHCISQWGYDFRPPYLEIKKIRDQFENISCIALTASATQRVVEDITAHLDFGSDYQIFRKSFERKNLSYSVYYEENKQRKILEILQNVSGTSIIYVRNRQKTEKVAKWLQFNGIQADFYHAGLTHEARNRKQDAWINDQTRVIVATNAFGMGIDKPNVRTVIHLDIPNDLESYYQEAGRAGRDELIAYAVLLYDKNDVLDLKDKFEKSYPLFSELEIIYQQLGNHFQIALDAGELQSFDFVLKDFVEKYQSDYLTTFYALKKIEELGFITFNESFHTPSKLLFKANKATLYKFQVANASLDPLIKTILRMYGGELFTNFKIIQEYKIAEQLGLKKEEVVKALIYLQKNNLIVYIAQNHTPKILFLERRLLTTSFRRKKKYYEERKQLMYKKMLSMIYYAENTSVCKTKVIVEYFDQKDFVSCGKCGVCIAEKKRQKKSLYTEDYTSQIIANIQEPTSIYKLIKEVKPDDEEDFKNQIKQLLDKGEIDISDDNKIYTSMK